MSIVIETRRLVIRTAEIPDAQILLQLWTDSRVMTNVGFPQGLDITLEEIEADIRDQDKASEFGKYLIAQLRDNGPTLGECKMVLPDEEGVSRTDVKLLPAHWGHKYGVEIKQALVDYLFLHTDCAAVEGTPNVANIASIKMQETVGAVRVGEDTFHFPQAKADFTAPVHHYIYHVTRAIWAQRREP
jgi:RimJ/RimL family protein N-acetyltransferase